MEEPEDYGSNLFNYVNRSLEDEEEFHFLRFEFLQRLNIVQLQVKLARLKSRIQKNGGAAESELEDLNTTMRDYARAIRDYEYLRNHKALDKAETRRRKMLLQRYFQSPSDFRDPFQSHYSSFQDTMHERVDPLRRAFMRYLPSRLAFSSREKQERKKEYQEGKAPKEVSAVVDRVVRLLIAFAGGAFLVVPMIIMTIDQSQTKSLVTVSAAVVLFALAVSLVVRVSNLETLASTATYAAVLVVFVGTTSGGSSSGSASG
ncbi:VIT family domain-containing protein [Pleurostoma richardsiae]|uniref:VIT family domain-containing protein n=1 Tax=Pleurostoma richardsiae TaxID=41990 RepID=A0AA38RDG0_9PEZI|nr:VIT family domain-containing protein [Pleurostoma richardsiae]